MTTPTPPPQAPDDTALVIERLKNWQWFCENTAKTFSRYEMPIEHTKELGDTLQSAITHLAAHAELQARCARLEEALREIQDFLWKNGDEASCAAYSVADCLLAGTKFHVTAARTAKEET